MPTTITIPRANNATYRLIPMIGGEEYVLKNSDTVIVTVKQRSGVVPVIEKRLTPADYQGGQLILEFLPSDTDIAPGGYLYDCAIYIGEEFYTFVQPSSFVVGSVVTRYEGDGGAPAGEIRNYTTISGAIERAETVYSDDYTLLKNKPRIGGTELVGDVSFEELGLVSFVNEEAQNSITLRTADTISDSSTNSMVAGAGAVRDFVLEAISGVETIRLELVGELPEAGQANVIYLVPNGDIHDEYIWMSSAWELIGTTAIDLSDYAKISYVDEQAAAKADKSTAIDLTLTADWVGSAAPYTQTVAVPGITSAANCIYDVAADVTAAQLEAYETARIVVRVQGADSLTFSAFGDKPVVAIPLTVVIVG